MAAETLDDWGAGLDPATGLARLIAPAGWGLDDAELGASRGSDLLANGARGFELTPLAGAGNRFLLLDLVRWPGPFDLPALARRLCAATLGARGERADGLLCLAPATGAADARMILFNADGSRPEACGNGLRCLALLARRLGRLGASGGRVETDAGERRVAFRATPVDGVAAEAQADSGAKARAEAEVEVEVEMGRPRLLARDARLLAGWPRQRWTQVDMGNPHACTQVAELERAALEEWGAALQAHTDFPRGVNVGAWCRGASGSELRLRVFERGVGETEACGTGACAAALSAVLTAGASWPLSVSLRGGRLALRMAPNEQLLLSGPVASWGGSA